MSVGSGEGWGEMLGLVWGIEERFGVGKGGLYINCC